MPYKSFHLEGRKYRNYSDNDIIKYAKEVYSMSGLLRKIGLEPVGGNFATIKRQISILKIDTSHWTKQGWNLGMQMKDFADYTKVRNAKKHLLYLKGNKCEECQLSEWRGKPIAIEIHHSDGDRSNNELNNLKLLCPNCHSLTPTWRGRTYRI